MEAACTNGGGCIYIFMNQASSTVSSVISSSESVDLSKLELLFSTVYIYIHVSGEQHGEQRDLQQRVGGPEQAGAPLLHCVYIYSCVRRAAL